MCMLYSAFSFGTFFLLLDYSFIILFLDTLFLIILTLSVSFFTKKCFFKHLTVDCPFAGYSFISDLYYLMYTLFSVSSLSTFFLTSPPFLISYSNFLILILHFVNFFLSLSLSFSLSISFSISLFLYFSISLFFSK